MLEKPELEDRVIINGLQKAYGLQAEQVTFLPLGADVATAVYRVVDEGGRVYFLKLRKGNFDEISVTLPQCLKDQGLRAIIAPLDAQDGKGWASLDEFTTILYPFIEAKD